MKKICLLLLCLPLLSSCSFVMIERQIYPICLSLDADDNGNFQIGVQAPRFSGSTTSQASYDILTATGETIDDALRTLSASTPYPLNFSQIRLCLVGYRLAATTNLRPLLRKVLELPTMRPTAYVSISLGTALSVMQNQQPDFGMRLSTHLSLLLDRMQKEHLLPDSTLASCVRELSDGRSDFLIGVSAVNTRLIPEEKEAQKESSTENQGGASSTPAFAIGEPWSDALLPPNALAGMIPHTSVNPVEYLGSAAISHQRVSGVLTADETQLALRLLSEATLQTAREGEQLQLQIWLEEESDLARNQEAIYEVVSRLQALRSDALTFGRICSMGFYTDEAWQSYRFDRRYPTASVWVGTEP